MILYLCRHGIAADKAASDAERPLTLEGRKKFRRAARGFARLKPGVRSILTSSLLRAAETAEILRGELAAKDQEPKLTVCEALAPPGHLEELLAAAREGAGEEGAGVVAVGHEPTLSKWVGRLCFGHGGRCELKRGAIAAVELGARGASGTLLWVLQPGQLRAI